MKINWFVCSQTIKFLTRPYCNTLLLWQWLCSAHCYWALETVYSWPVNMDTENVNMFFEIFREVKFKRALPSPSLPACSAAPPGRILDNMLSPSMPGWPAAALPIPPGLGAALEPGQKNREERTTDISFSASRSHTYWRLSYCRWTSSSTKHPIKMWLKCGYIKQTNACPTVYPATQQMN